MEANKLQDLLRANLDSLPSKARRVVEYLLTHMREAAFISIGDVAATLGVSKAQLVRVARILGFQGYAELKSALKESVLEQVNPAAMLAERRLDGLIVCVEYLPPDHDVQVLSALHDLRQYMPVVLIGCVPPSYDFPAVTNNSAAMMQEVVRYLTGLGHERIAFIGGVEEDRDPLRRDVGYENGLKDARLPYTASYRIYCKGTTEAGSAALNQMLDSLKPEYWPTAVIALNDLVAMGCMAAARDRGLSIPDQLSVIGCDNLFCAPYLYPPLTSINTYQQRTGARAVQLLISGENKQETADWELVERASCARLKP